MNSIHSLPPKVGNLSSFNITFKGSCGHITLILLCNVIDATKIKIKGKLDNMT